MIIIIIQNEHDDAEFRHWITDHPKGYVVNYDVPFSGNQSPPYPLVHEASCPTLHSKENYTTAAYGKICSTDLAGLRQTCEDIFRKQVTDCETCMKG
jgi:hypothetical protein